MPSYVVISVTHKTETPLPVRSALLGGVVRVSKGQKNEMVTATATVDQNNQ